MLDRLGIFQVSEEGGDMSNLCMGIQTKFEQEGPWKSPSETPDLTR